MSADFVLFRSPQNGALADLIRGALTDTIGNLVTVQTALGSLIPDLHWERMTASADAGLEMDVWCGVHEGQSRLQLIVELDGQVRIIHWSSTSRDEVERVRKALNLVAFDEASLQVLGGSAEPAVRCATDASTVTMEVEA